jgi:FkbM family methyltransferase
MRTLQEPFPILMQEKFKSKVLVDVGANRGSWTKPLAPYFKHVVAIEPNLINLDWLMDNLPFNVTVLNVAAGSENGFGVLHNAWSDSGGSLCPTDSGEKVVTRTVLVVKIDSLQLVDVGAIKVDTEGWDYHVLEGAIETIKRDRPTLCVELHGQPECSEEQEEQQIRSLLASFYSEPEKVLANSQRQLIYGV